MDMNPREADLLSDAIRDSIQEYAQSPISQLLVQINGLKACQKATEHTSVSKEVQMLLNTLVNDRIELLSGVIERLRCYTVPAKQTKLFFGETEE